MTHEQLANIAAHLGRGNEGRSATAETRLPRPYAIPQASAKALRSVADDPYRDWPDSADNNNSVASSVGQDQRGRSRVSAALDWSWLVLIVGLGGTISFLAFKSLP